MAKRRTHSLKRRTAPSSSSSSSSPSYACSEQESSSCEEDANIQKISTKTFQNTSIQ
eukprot:CAMPEP_0196805428 /NCGR_PEP_ID=MMETSP1362-20130617/5184_1 /TAXON_ID=163516 /ORGANISM="Leptocylindrus danicus, Strain CCMP1856" /LENGTH=56 /DNA_ID=CAMNT_0042178331 /DNA_START=15 /DNA_END=182 /DNA_ORIENTATION=+